MLFILTSLSGIGTVLSLKQKTSGPLYLSSDLLPGVCYIPCEWGTTINNLPEVLKAYYNLGYATVTLRPVKQCAEKYYRCETESSLK